MLNVEQLDPHSGAQVERFIDLPFRLYAATPQWVPPLRRDIHEMMDEKKHPFYDHGTAAFFIATRDGRDAGRIAVLENRAYNEFRNTRQAQFYLFESENDTAVAHALFERVFEWARARGLNRISGPRGFGPYDGYGLLVEGFEHRQMVMMNYNPAYYVPFIEGAGFRKEVDFVSCMVARSALPPLERVFKIAERVEQRGYLRVHRFKSKRELIAWAPRIGATYNKAFVRNWEYYPLSEREVKYVADTLMLVGDPRLIKIITHEDEIVGFMFAFPDISAALRRTRGRLFPFGWLTILREMKKTQWVTCNAAGILPEFHGHGGNAVLYSEMARTLLDYQFQFAELTQVAETAVQMRRDLENLGGKPYKNHRVFTREL